MDHRAPETKGMRRCGVLHPCHQASTSEAVTFIMKITFILQSERMLKSFIYFFILWKLILKYWSKESFGFVELLWAMS